MITWWELVKALPEIIQLLKVIQAAIIKAEADRKISDDVKTIHQALASGDASKLNILFNPPAVAVK